jgi:two-component system sensor histidine kinase UhpB
MLKSVCLLVLFCQFSFLLHSQDNAIDSFKNVLQAAPADTNKVNTYYKAGASLLYQDPLQAIPYFKQGLELAHKLNFIPGIERCYNGTSLSFSFNAKYDSALVYINHAVAYAVKSRNVKRMALAYLNRADVYTNLTNYTPALKDCDTAIRYSEQIANKDGLCRIYSIMGGIQMELKQYDDALASYDKSDSYCGQTKNRSMIGMNESVRGDLYILLQQPEKAVPHLRRAILIADSLEEVDNLSAYNNALAEALRQLKRYEEAETVAQNALRYSEQTGNVRQQSVIYDLLSNIAKGRNDFQPAIAYGLKAYNMMKAEKDLLREHAMSFNLSEVYRQSGNFAEAYRYLKISKELNDSLVRQQFATETAQLQTSLKVSEKDKEILLLNKDKELQEQDLQKQRLLMIGAFVVALLALTAIWLLVNRNKLRQRMKELELRNQIAADLHDEVGSSLSSIHMLSQMATKQDNDAAQKDILTRMSSNAKETMDKMGEIVWMIKPGETEAESLKQRMERFAYDIANSKNISLQLELQELENLKLTMEQRKNIYLIFKEAVNNAVKYSGTEQIIASTVKHSNQFVLTVKDNGKGFDAKAIANGNGLQNMKQRSKDLYAVLDIDSKEGTGTLIKLTMPL